MSTQTQDLENLRDRLNRVEKTNGTLRWLWLMTLLGLVGFALAGAAPTTTKVIEAERFTVKDANGNPRSSWGVAADGGITLGFADKDGKSRVTLTVAADGSPVLYLYGKNQTRRFLLYINESDSPELILFDRQEKKRLG